MELYEKLDLLGKAFSCGETDELKNMLIPDCKYNSDYAHKRFTSAEQILDSMHGACTYRYEIVKLETLLKEGIRLADLRGTSTYILDDLEEGGLLLYPDEAKEPVAVVYIKTNPVGDITEINLSRSRKWFDIEFYEDNNLETSEKDIPYTVEPLSLHDCQVKALQAAWTYQNHENRDMEDDEVYVWRKADSFFRNWLEDNGYVLTETQIFDDCIGYRCHRKNCAYTVYMFAYGQRRNVQFDGELCRKLLDYELSGDNIVLVVCLNVKRDKTDDEIRYSVCGDSGDEDGTLNLWKVSQISEKTILEFYPCKEIKDAMYRLMYAFNRDNRDVYDCIMSRNPAFRRLEGPGISMNEAFYTNMFRLHKTYGDMKTGYVSFGNLKYSKIPYIEGYGFFDFRLDYKTNKIQEVTVCPFDGRDRKVAEFIRTEEKECDAWFADVPAAIDVEVLPPVHTERFAMKILFDNGECKKYVLPIQREYEKAEAVSYEHHVFTDKIWQTAKIEKSSHPYRGTVISFSNDFFVSAMQCYEEGTPYSEPVLCNEVVYENDDYRIERKWKWSANSAYEDEETGLLKTLISGSAFNHYSASTYAARDGKQRCSIDFDYIDGFQEGLALVGKAGCGYGFIDKNMNFIIPMIYENAENFRNGKAKVKRDGEWFHIDKWGNETAVGSETANPEYESIGEYHEGLCKVSTLKLGFMDLAYYSDYAEIAGTWGFINEAGEEVIPPQYIYAEDFSDGMAIVCKGKWTIDEKWDNEYNTGRYWTEEELWGAIDKEGKEVIPFLFDEIQHISDDEDAFAAHYGGWDEGHWGIIDKRGNWLADPVFEEIQYGYHDGLFSFYNEDPWEDDALVGIYDVKQQKIIFEPQFHFVSFRRDGWIEVKVFDETLGRIIEKIIDRQGNERFHSIYSSIYTWKTPYEVVIFDEEGNHRGLIDENGNVILECNQEDRVDISYEQKLIVFREGGKLGLKDFDGKILADPKYYEIDDINRPMVTVRIGDEDHFKEGLITRSGKEAIPVDYERIGWLKDDYFVCCKEGLCEMYQMTDKHSKRQP